jgi:DMSO reductase anchor subunit
MAYGTGIQLLKLQEFSLQSIYMAVILLVAGEMIGRYLFFATAVSMQNCTFRYEKK